MIFAFLIIWILFGVGGYHMGKEKSVGAEGGAALGLLLGLLGIIIILCLPARKDVYDKDAYDQEIERSYQKINESSAEKVATADELHKWFELKQKGAITDEEFQLKKREIM
jgi:hypothetical protein